MTTARPVYPRVRPNKLLLGLRPSRAEFFGCCVVALGLTVLGTGLAVLWRWWAPSLTVLISPRGALVTEEQPEQFITSDGRYALIVAAAGVLAGVAAWCVRRWRGPLMLLALGVGGFAGSYAMWLLGEELGASTGHDIVSDARLGETVSAPVVELNAMGLLFLQPLLIVLTYVVCTSWSSTPDLRSRPAVAAGAGGSPADSVQVEGAGPRSETPTGQGSNLG